jgi:hypothetical protein
MRTYNKLPKQPNVGEGGGREGERERKGGGGLQVRGVDALGRGVLF